MRRRFLARQAQAAFYADFSDFSFWRLQVEGAHFIGGFGRIVDLEPGDLLIPLAGAEAVVEAEEGIVAHMTPSMPTLSRCMRRALEAWRRGRRRRPGS